MLNHADRIKVGCLAQLVNVIAPIMTEPGGPAWKQATYHPIEAVTRARGNVLVADVTTEEVPTQRYGDVPAVAAAAVHDPATGELTTYLTNRADRAAEVSVEFRGTGRLRVQSCRGLIADHEGPRGRRESGEISLVDLPARALEDRLIAVTVPPESWVAVVSPIVPGQREAAAQSEVAHRGSGE